MNLCKLIGERIKEERLRLNLSQEEFGAFGGVKRNAQRKYESGETYPDTKYFEGIAEASVDLVYIVSGKRDAPPESLYPTIGDAMMAVIDVQADLGLSFTADQLKELNGLAWEAQLNRDQLKDAVIVAYRIHNVSMPDHQ